MAAWRRPNLQLYYKATTTTPSMAVYRHSSLLLIYLPWIGLLLITQGVSSVRVGWDMQESDWDPRKEGTDVTITCTAVQLRTAFSAVSIEKSSPGEKLELVATNQVVEEKFRDLRYKGRIRYRTTYDLLQNHRGFIGTIVLTIKGVQSEDAGYYRCKAEGRHTEFRTLAVRVPIEDIYMTKFTLNDTYLPVADATTIYMKENSPGGIGCSVAVRTQFIQPKVHFTSGGRDITRLFMQSAPELALDKKRPTYLYKYSYRTAKPNPDLHKEEVVCTAYSVGFEGQRGKALVMMDIEFRPMISCEHYEYYAQTGSGVTMICSIKANPRALITFRFGYYLSDHVYEVSRTYLNDGQYSFTKTEGRGGYSNISFSISPVRRSQFQYSYKLEAQNEYGSAATTLILYEGINGMRIINCSSKAAPLMKGFYAFLIFILLLRHLQPKG